MNVAPLASIFKTSQPYETPDAKPSSSNHTPRTLNSTRRLRSTNDSKTTTICKMSLIVRYLTRATAIASKAVATTQNDQRRYHRCNGSTSIIDIAHIYPQLYTPKEARLPLHGLKLYRIHPFANDCARPQPKTESVANKKVDTRRPSKILAEQCDPCCNSRV